MKIKIKCIINNSLISDRELIITDNKEIISRKKIDKLGTYTFDGEINRTYQIHINYNNQTYNSTFIIRKCFLKPYIFYFNDLNKNHHIILSLEDKNYQGLKIEKGVISLWPNNIQLP